MKKSLFVLLSVLLVLFLVACNQNASIDDVYEAQSYGAFKVKDSLYLNLQDAIKSVSQWGGEVKGDSPIIYLLKDVTDSGAVIDSNVIIDFGTYTYTLSGSKTGIEIKEGCSVEVTGGTFKSKENDESLKSFFNSNGSLVLSNTTIELSNTNLNAIETIKGETDVSGKVSIVVNDNSNIVVAGGSSKVIVDEDAEVSLKGSFDLSGEAQINLANSDLTLTRKMHVEGNAVSIELSDMTGVGETPVFSSQPKTMNISPGGKSIDLICTVENNPYVVYQWYISTDGTKETGTPIANATEATFAVPDYSEKGIYYYYCEAKDLWAGESESVLSDVVIVAYTGLPTVYIDTPNGVAITSKEDWVKKSTLSISGASDNSWTIDGIETSIRGRGNSTWGQPKKPYALKLKESKAIMGMPSHKRWVLIANYLDNSFMKNTMAFYLSESLGLDYTVRGEYVDLILNGEYKGLYWFGEAIKEGDFRVDIDEDEDYLIEMDVYYDEIWKFESSIRKMPYMIKNDDSMTDEKLDYLKSKVSELEMLLYPNYEPGMNTNNCIAPDESYKNYLDVDSWAKFWLVNEIMDNGELCHPKSCYFSFQKTTGIIKAGPVWDFDWATLWESSTCRLVNYIYYNALFKSSTFVNRVKEIWDEKKVGMDILQKVDGLKSKLNIAQEYDSLLWGVHLDPSGVEREDFNAYVTFLETAILNKMTVVDNYLNSLTL